VLRAGPFSDERVRRLANRRFVCLYFDLADDGAAGDPDARKFVVKLKKELGGNGVPPPNVLLVTPDGVLAGEAGNFEGTDEVYSAMRKALKDKPEFDAESETEKAAATPFEKAQIAFDLGKRKTAVELLAEPRSEKEWLFLAHVQRWRGKWEEMEAALKHVTDEAMQGDVLIERAWRAWKEEKYETLRDLLADFPAGSARETEAKYFAALARYHLGEKKEALKAWKALAKAEVEDPWVYRADWAYMSEKQRGKTSFSSGDADRSPLGRIGYMGRENPDLKGPGR
jgi:hypothetical protein